MRCIYYVYGNYDGDDSDIDDDDDGSKYDKNDDDGMTYLDEFQETTKHYFT